MRLRNDYVSNSSSCSFIIHIATEDDLKHLTSDEIAPLLHKYASDVAHTYDDACHYGGLPYWDVVDNLQVGDFIRIYLGEDSDFNWDWNDPYYELSDVLDKLNSGYKKIQHYSDEGAHVTIGENYHEDKK